MRRFKPKGLLDRSAAADLFKHTLSQIPTLYGRLTYLASLRDPNSGIYRHYGLSAAFGREQSIRAFQVSHTKTFREWLKLPLSQKSSDLAAYFETLEEPRSVIARHLLRSKGFLTCVPDSASKAERTHFSAELELLLDLITRVAGRD